MVLGLAITFAMACLAGPCTSGDTLQNYLTLPPPATCNVGGLTFSGFEIVPGLFGATPIDPSGVTVNVLNSPTSPGLQFLMNSPAGPGDLFDLFLRFRVDASALDKALLSMTGATATGDGAVTAILDGCAGGAFPTGEPLNCPTTPGNVVLFAIESDQVTADEHLFPISSFFDIFVDITIDGGPNGTAGLGSVDLRLDIPTATEVPEPRTEGLLLAGVAVLCALARRMRTRQ
jgi:hypothetical protein